MKVGDIVRVFNERGLDEVGYVKRLGSDILGGTYLIVYLTGRCIGQEQFFSENNVLLLKTDKKCP